MTQTLPVAARLAWWGTSWLRGRAAPDDLLDALHADEAPHRVTGLLLVDGQSMGLIDALSDLRRRGATALGAAFPVEGDPVGLGGPPDFNRHALDRAEAVIAWEPGIGLVPGHNGGATVWHSENAARRSLVDSGEADRALRAALIESAAALADLDVARWRPEVADQLMDLRRRYPVSAPPGVPAMCVELASRGLQAMAICELALEDDGAAVTAAEADVRRSALLPLDRAGRRALTAACSPEVWPPDPI